MTADEKHASTSFNRQLHEKAILGRASWGRFLQPSFDQPISHSSDCAAA